MKHYIVITLLPDPETPLYYLWSKVYQQIHLALVESQQADNQSKIGLAFPGYLYIEKGGEYTLGNKLRLFASGEEALEALNIQKHLVRLIDYVHISTIKEVPADVSKYVCFSRVQSKSNVQRLARRKAKRESISLVDALSVLNGYQARYLKEPYIQLKSLSSNHEMRLFIRKQESGSPVSGMFSTYGLSPSATVPWFD